MTQFDLVQLSALLGFDTTLPVPLLVGGLFALVCVALSLVLASLRLLKGPTLPDRVVALDLITTTLVALFLLLALLSDVAPLLDSAIVLALVGFLGTVAFARFIERSGRSYDQPTRLRPQETKR